MGIFILCVVVILVGVALLKLGGTNKFYCSCMDSVGVLTLVIGLAFLACTFLALAGITYDLAFELPQVHDALSITGGFSDIEKAARFTVAAEYNAEVLSFRSLNESFWFDAFINDANLAKLTLIKE